MDSIDYCFIIYCVFCVGVVIYICNIIDDLHKKNKYSRIKKLK